MAGKDNWWKNSLFNQSTTSCKDSSSYHCHTLQASSGNLTCLIFQNKVEFLMYWQWMNDQSQVLLAWGEKRQNNASQAEDGHSSSSYPLLWRAKVNGGSGNTSKHSRGNCSERTACQGTIGNPLVDGARATVMFSFLLVSSITTKDKNLLS